MQHAHKKLDTVFNGIYLGTICAMVAILFAYFLMGFVGTGFKFGFGIFLLLSASIFILWPFLIFLCCLSIWGLVKYKGQRIKYTISLVAAIVWLILSRIAAQNWVLP